MDQTKLRVLAFCLSLLPSAVFIGCDASPVQRTPEEIEANRQEHIRQMEEERGGY